MREFEYFIKIEEVRKKQPNLPLARSLVLDMQQRIKDASALDMDRFPKIIFESIYDALRDFCDALLSLEGYKSYSHEASIAYLSKKGFDIVFISELDNYRYKRNGSKYYGTKISTEDAKAISGFYERNKAKLYKILKEKGLCRALNKIL